MVTFNATFTSSDQKVENVSFSSNDTQMNADYGKIQKVTQKGWLNTDLILTVQRFWVDDAAFVNKWRSVFLQTDVFCRFCRVFRYEDTNQ